MIVRQHCCKKPTQFPDKMKYCESIQHTIASYISDNKSIDHIISIEKYENTLDISTSKVLPYLITDHKPIFCIVNNIPILSWNIEGICNLDRFTPIQKVLIKLHKKYPSIIFLFQELFLQNDLSNLRNKQLIRLKQLFNHPDYTYKTDHYTSGAIIPTHLYKSLKLIPRKNSKKNAMVLHINSEKPFYLVNMHLKAVRSLSKNTINNTHIQEVSNILNHLTSKFNKGVVFIGDHNNPDILPIYNSF